MVGIITSKTAEGSSFGRCQCVSVDIGFLVGLDRAHLSLTRQDNSCPIHIILANCFQSILSRGDSCEHSCDSFDYCFAFPLIDA